jgi:hypothetical protein
MQIMLSYIKLGRLNFKVSYDCHDSTCMKRLRAHPRHLTPASKLASCKRGFNTAATITVKHEQIDAVRVSRIYVQPRTQYPKVKPSHYYHAGDKGERSIAPTNS